VQIEITSRHARVQEEEKQHIREKINQLTHFWNRPLSVRAVIDLEKYDYRVELIIHAGHNHFSVTESNRSLQTAVDKAAKVAERRLRRIKGKTAGEQKRRRRVFISEVRENAGEDDLPELLDLKDYEIEEMTRSEGIDRLKESGRNFQVYYDLEAGKNAIIYRKKNQALGFIEL